MLMLMPLARAGEGGVSSSHVDELGLKVVMNKGERSYHYALPDNVETPAFETIGPLTWKYMGQMEFFLDGGPARGVARARQPSRILTDVSYDPDGYLGVGETVRLDAYGRAWVLADFDEDALWRKIEAYDALVAREVGLEPDRAERQGYQDNPSAGMWEESVLDTSTWDNDVCTNEVEFKVEDFVSDEGGSTRLTKVTTPYDRQRKTVLIMGVVHDTGDQYLGSGVMVDNDTVLTAAHVIANENGYTDWDNMRVCTLGNVYAGAECQSVLWGAAPGGRYDGSIANDYGVLQLDHEWPHPIGWMAMSAASDSTLEAATHYHEGYPVRKSHCGTNLTTDSAYTRVDGKYPGKDYSSGVAEDVWFDYYGSWLWKATGPVRSTPSGVVKFNVSSAGGMSGGPYYFCPSGCTETSGAHFITAITSGHAPMGVDMYTAGAKARNFRDWVIAHM